MALFITPMAGTALKIFETQIQIQCGGISVFPGDIVFGDNDGVVVIAEDEILSIIKTAEDVQKKEEKVLSRINRGTSLFEYVNFSEHYEKIGKNQHSRLKYILE